MNFDPAVRDGMNAALFNFLNPPSLLAGGTPEKSGTRVTRPSQHKADVMLVGRAQLWRL